MYIFALVSFYAAVEGFGGSVLVNGSLPLFVYTFHTSIEYYQRAMAIAYAPWSIRALVAIVSDTLPIAGHHKLWYAAAAAIGIPAFYGGLAAAATPGVALACLCLASSCIMVLSTLFNGDYVVRMQNGGNQKLIEVTWAFTVAGAILGVIAMGALANTVENAPRIRIAYTMSAVLGLPLIWFLLNTSVFNDKTQCRPLRLLEDSSSTELGGGPPAPPPTPTITRGEIEVAVMLAAAPVFLSVLIGTSVPAWVSLVLALCILGGILARTVVVYGDHPTYWKACVFLALSEVAHVDVTAAINVFYTTVCGTNFSLFFFTFWTNIVSYGMIGVMLLVYTAWFKWKGCRFNVIVGTVIWMLGNVTDVAIGRGWSAGIPNELFFLLGDGMVASVGSALCEVSQMQTMTRVVVPGKEATMTATAMSFRSIGQLVSRMAGTCLMQHYGISHTGGCYFEGYVPMLLAAHTVLPMFIFPMAYLLLPTTPALKEE
jgi:hypothetical protein